MNKQSPTYSSSTPATSREPFPVHDVPDDTFCLHHLTYHVHSTYSGNRGIFSCNGAQIQRLRKSELYADKHVFRISGHGLQFRDIRKLAKDAGLERVTDVEAQKIEVKYFLPTDFWDEFIKLGNKSRLYPILPQPRQRDGMTEYAFYYRQNRRELMLRVYMLDPVRNCMNVEASYNADEATKRIDFPPICRHEMFIKVIWRLCHFLELSRFSGTPIRVGDLPFKPSGCLIRNQEQRDPDVTNRMVTILREKGPLEARFLAREVDRIIKRVNEMLSRSPKAVAVNDARGAAKVWKAA